MSWDPLAAFGPVVAILCTGILVAALVLLFDLAAAVARDRLEARRGRRRSRRYLR